MACCLEHERGVAAGAGAQWQRAVKRCRVSMLPWIEPACMSCYAYLLKALSNIAMYKLPTFVHKICIL